MTTFEKSSGNVFADLGFPDAETHLQKARLVARIQKRIAVRNLTQVQAAKILGMSQPDVSKMLRGQFRTMTLDRLMECLLALGDDVKISVVAGRGTVKVGTRGKLRVVAA